MTRAAVRGRAAFVSARATCLRPGAGDQRGHALRCDRATDAGARGRTGCGGPVRCASSVELGSGRSTDIAYSSAFRGRQAGTARPRVPPSLRRRRARRPFRAGPAGSEDVGGGAARGGGCGRSRARPPRRRPFPSPAVGRAAGPALTPGRGLSDACAGTEPPPAPTRPARFDTFAPGRTPPGLRGRPSRRRWAASVLPQLSYPIRCHDSRALSTSPRYHHARADHHAARERAVLAGHAGARRGGGPGESGLRGRGRVRARAERRGTTP